MTLETVTALIGSLIHEPQAGLLSGILFGVKANISKELHDALITTGTLHIIALSGMNISILVSLVNLFLLRFLRRPIANVATSLIIIGFISFVGTSPSVLRAAIMAGISLLGVAFGRQTWPLLAWILAVISMLVLNPLWIGDLSFQLSVMATLGILLFSRKQKNPEEKPINGATNHSLTHGIWSFIEDDLRVTLAAQVFTIPIILFQFHRISLVSPLSNILIGWLMAPIMILGFLLVLVGMIWAPLASIVAWVVWVPLTVVIQVILWTARIPFASITW